MRACDILEYPFVAFADPTPQTRILDMVIVPAEADLPMGSNTNIRISGMPLFIGSLAQHGLVSLMFIQCMVLSERHTARSSPSALEGA